MEITKNEAKKISKKWGWRRLPRNGKQYFHVCFGYTEILEKNTDKYYYGWVSSITKC